jgi:pimeloyl-ACP methyl ester carboxylesterase
MDETACDAKAAAGQPVQALFVHGMGRSPLSGWPLLWRLKRAGLRPHAFGYAVTASDFSTIADRLVDRMEELARHGHYIVIGHSLGGLLLREAIARLPPNAVKPRHLFLLGSPVQAARLAQGLRHNPIFRTLTRDCGQLLGSGQRMREIKPIGVAVTAVTGIRGAPKPWALFAGEANDGIVSASETAAEWITDRVELPLVHTLLPSSPRVADAILERLESALPARSKGAPRP